MLYSRQNRRRSKAPSEFVWPAPVAGLISSGTEINSDPRGCALLENFIPTAEGSRLRGGALSHSVVDGEVRSLFTYRSGVTENLFAATETTITDVSVPNAGLFGVLFMEIDGEDVILTLDGDALTLPFPAPDVGGLTSGDWSHVQFATAGGQFLVIANGSDSVRNFNGAAWSVPAITNVDSADLSFVWAHKRRLWFVEGNTLSAWYLPVNSIAGAAVAFPLDGVFSLGGALLFGGTWSQDSGDGLDDLAVFVTTEGQIAVYQGTDPDNAATWALVGVYQIGKPLGKTSWFRAGGDLVILTEDGIVPVSEALMKDRAALQAAAITSPIEDLWQRVVASRDISFRFPVALWSTKTTLVVGIPTLDDQLGVLVANTRTGAWATITGWPVSSLAVYQDRLYFGTPSGFIARGDESGSDFGVPYAGRYVPRFQEMGTTEDKIALHARVIFKTAENADPRLVAFQNYQIDTFPPEGEYAPPSGDVWGSGVWGQSKWGASLNTVVRSDWQSVSGMGFSQSVGLIVGSQSATAPTFELLGLILRYEVGRSI